MKYLIPHGREAEFTQFLKAKYDIVLDDIPDDEDISDKISDFIYGQNKKEENSSDRDSFSKRIEELYRSKVSLDDEMLTEEVVWYKALRRGVGDMVYVVEMISPNKTIRLVLKDRDDSESIMRMASSGMLQYAESAKRGA
jgi:hypothetical protein